MLENKYYFPPMYYLACVAVLNCFFLDGTE